MSTAFVRVTSLRSCLPMHVRNQPDATQSFRLEWAARSSLAALSSFAASRSARGPQKCDVASCVVVGDVSTAQRRQKEKRRYCVEFLLQLAWTMKRSRHTTKLVFYRLGRSNREVEYAVGQCVNVVHGAPGCLQARRVSRCVEQYGRRPNAPSHVVQSAWMGREEYCAECSNALAWLIERRWRPNLPATSSNSRQLCVTSSEVLAFLSNETPTRLQ